MKSKYDWVTDSFLIPAARPGSPAFCKILQYPSNKISLFASLKNKQTNTKDSGV